jgi:hypothetical protein
MTLFEDMMLFNCHYCYLKDYCHTVVSQARFAIGGHFVLAVSNVAIYFYNPSCNRAILQESFIILLELNRY